MAVPGVVVDRLILDTNVIEYLFDPDIKRKDKATKIVAAIRKGRYEGILSPPVIMELYYRLSDNIGERNAVNFLKTLIAIPNMHVLSHTVEMGHTAGKFYYKYNTTSTSQKKPSAVDCLIAGMEPHLHSSRICTNDNKILDIVEASSVRFWNVVTG